MNDTTTNEKEEGETLDVNVPHKQSSGPLIGIIIIVLVMALGGVYFWKTTLQERNDATTDEAVATEVEALKTQGTSDDINSIEADLSATDLDALNSELDSIGAELNL
jgi:uncharacterized protein HemX